MEAAALDLGTTSVKTGLLRPAETWGAGFALEGHDAAYVMVWHAIGTESESLLCIIGRKRDQAFV